MYLMIMLIFILLNLIVNGARSPLTIILVYFSKIFYHRGLTYRSIYYGLVFYRFILPGPSIQ